MYNPPRGDNILLYVKSGYSPPDELTLHVSTEPISQSDVNASLGAMVALSEAVFYQQVDCSPRLNSLSCEAELSLPHANGDTDLRSIVAETATAHVIPCVAEAALSPLSTATSVQFRGRVTGDARMSPMVVFVDFHINGDAVLQPFFVESALALVIPAVGDSAITAMLAESTCLLLTYASADATICALGVESATTCPLVFTVYADVLAYSSVDMDKLDPPTTAAPSLTNILQFSR